MTSTSVSVAWNNVGKGRKNPLVERLVL